MCNAKEYLQQIRKIERLIYNKTVEKKHWEQLTMELATNITANMGGERVQSSGSKQRMADTVDSGLDRVRRIQQRINELQAELDAIIAVIEMLPSDQYDILHKVYVQYMSLKEVAATGDKSYSWVATNHGIALKMVSDILKQQSAKESKQMQEVANSA